MGLLLSIGLVLATAGCSKATLLGWHTFLDPTKNIAAGEESEIVPVVEQIDPMEDVQEMLPNAEPPTMEDLSWQEDDYIIGPRDVISIQIMNLYAQGQGERVDREVSDDGFVMLPELPRRVKVTGMNVDDVRLEVANAYQAYEYLREPSVNVQVLGRQQSNFNIIGAVRAAGNYPIRMREFRILDALTLAGDISTLNVPYIYVMRQTPATRKLARQAKPPALAEGGATDEQVTLAAQTQPGGPSGEEDLLATLKQFMPGAEPASQPESPATGPTGTAPAAPPAAPAAPAVPVLSPIPAVPVPSIPVPAVADIPAVPAEMPAPAETLPEPPAPAETLPAPTAPAEPPASPAPPAPSGPLQQELDALKKPLPPGVGVPELQPIRPSVIHMSETAGAAGGRARRGAASPGEWKFVNEQWVLVPATLPAEPAAATLPLDPWADRPSAPDAGDAAAGPAVPAAGGPEGQETPAFYTDSEDPFNWAQADLSHLVRVIAVDLSLLKEADPRQNIVIRDGDTILVPLPQVGEFYVIGEVVRPGQFGLTGRKITVKMALATAGGFSPTAWPGNALLIRRLAHGQELRKPIRLDRIMEGKDPDIVLQPDDVIAVGTHVSAYFLAVLRGAFRASYGFGFVYDRNFADKNFGQYQDPEDVIRFFR